MNRRSTIGSVLGVVCASAILSACVETGGDRAWGLEERRSLLRDQGAEDPREAGPTLFEVLTPLGIERSKVAISAREELLFEAGSKLSLNALTHTSAVLGRGRASVGRGVQIGSIYGGREGLLLEADARVNGYVKSCGPIRGEQARVTVGIQSGTGCETETFRWSVEFPRATSGDRESSSAGPRPLELEPGAYGQVTVKPRSALRLRAGTYHVGALDVQRDGVLELDNTAGPIFVWVKTRLALDGTLHDYSLLPSILIGYAGSAPPALNTSLRGTLVAPFATVRLPRVELPHGGALFAKSVEFSAGAVLDHRAFALAAPPNRRIPELGALCRGCAERAERLVRQCCAARSRAQAQARRAAARCWASCSSEAACASACALETDASTVQASAWFEACLHAVSLQYGECQLQAGYRPDSCSSLNGAGYEPVTCAPERL